MRWLRKLFGLADAPPAARATRSDVRVTHDETSIEVRDRERGAGTMDWSRIVRVSIETTDAGPFAADLFWIIEDGAGGRLTIPLGAEGERELLTVMQHRQEGFDNMAVVEAMGSTEVARFTVWEAKPV